MCIRDRLFSGLGTLIFLTLTKNKLPSYLGSSFAFIAPLTASQQYGMAAQLGGVLVTGLALIIVGFIVQAAGKRVIDAVMPPVVTGAIVALIGSDDGTGEHPFAVAVKFPAEATIRSLCTRVIHE